MTFYTFIRKCLSLILLVIFTISITPKPIWHSLFAGHVDVPVKCDHPNTSKHCIHPIGFNCHFDNLVVNTDYFPTLTDIQFTLQEQIANHIPGIFDSYSTNNYRTQDNKGPPVSV